MLIDRIAIALIIATARSAALPTFKVESRSSSSSSSRSEIEAPFTFAENLTIAEFYDQLAKILNHPHLPLEFNFSVPFEHKWPSMEIANTTAEDYNKVETETEIETSTLEPRRDFPDWSARPGGVAPCPGWPARTRFNETHWREWHFRCFCYRYGMLDKNCEMPYHYGWGNGQYDGDGARAAGNVKCLKKTWWGCKETEKPHRVQ